MACRILKAWVLHFLFSSDFLYCWCYDEDFTLTSFIFHIFTFCVLQESFPTSNFHTSMVNNLRGAKGQWKWPSILDTIRKKRVLWLYIEEEEKVTQKKAVEKPIQHQPTKNDNHCQVEKYSDQKLLESSFAFKGQCFCPPHFSEKRFYFVVKPTL